jgi:hypothetical protein
MDAWDSERGKTLRLLFAFAMVNSAGKLYVLHGKKTVFVVLLS